jgi:hypothetical protein
MRRLLIATLLVFLAGTAGAQYETSFIGIAADPAHDTCYADWPLGSAVDLFFNVYILPEIDGVTGAEFSVLNLPVVEQPDVFITESWFGLVIGNLIDGFSIALDEPAAGPLVALGTINYFVMTDTGAVGPDHFMEVVEALDSGKRIITDLTFQEINVDGGFFTFNCSDPALCDCVDDTVANAAASWGSIKALY